MSKEPQDASFNKVKCRELTLVDENDKDVLVVAPAEGGAGMWIYSPTGQIVAIFATKNDIGIGLFGKNQDSMPIVITLDEDEGPVIQVKIGNKILELNSEDLERLDMLGFTSHSDSEVAAPSPSDRRRTS